MMDWKQEILKKVTSRKVIISAGGLYICWDFGIKYPDMVKCCLASAVLIVVFYSVCNMVESFKKKDDENGEQPKCPKTDSPQST